MNLIEGLVLTFIASFQVGVTTLGILSDGDWSRINGSQGALFLAVIAVIILWSRSVVKERNEDRRRTREEMAREARNAELLEALKEADNSNKILTEKCIVAIVNQTAATEAFNSTIQHHTNFLCEKIDGLKK